MIFRKSLWPLAFLICPACGVILSRNARLGQRVEQGAFADVGQADDAAFQTHGISLVVQPFSVAMTRSGQAIATRLHAGSPVSKVVKFRAGQRAGAASRRIYGPKMVSRIVLTGLPNP